MSRASTFDAKDYSLEAFILERAPSFFEIPDYQRRFVWETKNLTDFLDAIIKNPGGYYIGSFVVVRPEHFSYDIQIIDGQQRITALSFMVKVLSDLSHKRGLEIPSRLKSFCDELLYKSGEPRISFNDTYFNNHLKILLTERNPLDVEEIKAWFRQIADDQSKDSHGFKKERLLANRKAITRLFNTYKDIQKYFDLFSDKELIEAIDSISNLQLIEIVCKDITVVNDLFEGLNSKGVQLNTAELIKSRLYGKINRISKEDGEGNLSKELWEEMDLAFFVEEDKRLIDKFLRHFWISQHGYISGIKLYDEYVKSIQGLERQKDVETFVSELKEYSSYYLAIRSLSLEPSNHGILMDQGVYERFNDFGRLNNDQIYEVLLAFIGVIKNDPAREVVATKDLKIILQKLWAFCFRLQFIPVSPSKYENRFAELCMKTKVWIKESRPFASETIQFIAQELAPMVKESQVFIDNLASQLVYKNSQQNNRLLEKVFYDLFFEYDHDNGLKRQNLMYKKPTIEHILPQTPKEWGYTKVQVSDFVNSVGNLTLLDEIENLKADNHTFDFKLKNVFRNNAFKFNKDLAEYAYGYGSKDLFELSHTIEKRAQQIAEILDKVYSL